MVISLEYGERDSTPLTIIALLLTSILCFFAFFQWDFTSLFENSFSSSHTSWASLEVIMIWRFVCFFLGLSAVIFMLRTEPGIMQVLLHEERNEKTLYPAGLENLVTFSSWNLLINMLYFLLAGIISLVILSGNEVALWLNNVLIIFFSAALGASFLTSTVVRFIILPGEVINGRNHDNFFNFQNQLMHNFAAIFVALELLLVQPKLHPEFAVFGLIFGLIYTIFAYIFAFYGGGYYAYSFIDPRFRLAPFLMSGLAVAIAIFYLGLWALSQLLNYNFLIGTIVLLVWVSIIVQFRSRLPK